MPVRASAICIKKHERLILKREFRFNIVSHIIVGQPFETAFPFSSIIRKSTLQWSIAMKYWLRNSFAILIPACAVITNAQAQATRTWVSGVGDDVNPCSRTAPCKTFAGAISKTAAGGEISVLDPGGYGAVTITKSITLNGEGTLASILASGTNGIVISAASTDIIRLRNISINGAKNTASPGLNGIRFLTGNTLEIDNVSIYGFANNGIDLSGGSNLLVKNSSITNIGLNGVNVSGSSGKVSAVLDNVSIHKAAKGVDSLYAQAVTTIGNSVITQNSGFGVHAEAGKIGLQGSSLTNNGVAVQVEAGAKVWLTDNDLFNNTTLFVGCAATTFLTNLDNRTGGNGALGCTPTTPIDLK